MAGGNQPAAVNMDPALVKWYNMSSNRYKYFKWTPRTARITVIYTMIIPAAVAYLAYKTEGKYEFRGKRKEDTLVEF